MRSPARARLLLLCGAAVPASSLPWGRKKTPEAIAEPQARTETAFAKPVVLGANSKKVMVNRPSRPGCWMRIPSGCPNDPMDTQKWRHDAWAEAEGLDEAGCLQRVNIWKGYCGSGDVMMVFVANETRSEPFSALQISAVQSWPWTRKKTQEAPETAQQAAPAADKEGAANSTVPRVLEGHPGCWMRMASGCPKRPMQTQQWRRDTWAEQQGVGQAGCQQRAAVWNKLCGSQDAVMAFVASEAPSEALVAGETPIAAFGAAVANETPSEASVANETALEAPAANETPSEAFVANETSSEQWLPDPWSEGASSDPAPRAGPPLSALQASATESWPWSRRKAEQADKEGTVKAPTRPGCWMRMPSGCPKNPMQTQHWRRDTWAEQQGVDQVGCQQRAAMWNGYCGSQDAVMAFVVDESPPSDQVFGAEAPHEASESVERVALAGGGAEESEQAPSGPGCWFRMPADCHGRDQGMSAWMLNENAVHRTTGEATQSQLWNHDTWAEQQGVDEAGCQARAAVWTSFCRSQGVAMAFVPEQSFRPFVPA